jgi:hypothetical protein
MDPVGAGEWHGGRGRLNGAHCALGTGRLGRSYQFIIDDARKRWFMKKVWSKPELRRLVAGGAETTNSKRGVDSASQGGGNNYS